MATGIITNNMKEEYNSTLTPESGFSLSGATLRYLKRGRIVTIACNGVNPSNVGGNLAFVKNLPAPRIDEFHPISDAFGNALGLCYINVGNTTLSVNLTTASRMYFTISYYCV